jgi:pyrroloquinoline quinone biosynthesis protein D
MNRDDLQRCPALAPHVRLQTDQISGEGVLLFPEGVLELNSTAHEILRRCDGATSVANLVAALAAEYDAPAHELERDVLETLEQLSSRRVVIFAS